ncbi:MAG: hypothetical protein PGN34_17885 [Methylobacterium frigidaeris]
MSTRERLARAGRLLKVQEQMRRGAEWELAATRGRAAEIREAEADLMTRLSAEGPLHGLFLDSAARRLRALARDAAAAEALAQQQEAVARERALEQKRSERRIGHLAAERRQEQERRDALDRLDGIVARGEREPG